MDKLINNSLLLVDCGHLRMNGLIRNMAYHIMNQSHTYMVKYHEMLRKLPQKGCPNVKFVLLTLDLVLPTLGVVFSTPDLPQKEES